MKTRIIILTLMVFLVLPLVTAGSISNTNLSNSNSGNLVQVDSMTLTKLVINDTAIELYNVSSIGTNFTNMNLTANSSLYFYGLIIDLAVFNVNISNYLFNSTVGSQDYPANFNIGNVLRILNIGVVITGNTTCGNVTTSKIIVRISDGVSPYGRMCYGISFMSFIPLINWGVIWERY